MLRRAYVSGMLPRGGVECTERDALPYTFVLAQYLVTVCVCPRRVLISKSVQTLRSLRSLPAQSGYLAPARAPARRSFQALGLSETSNDM